jgi:hypothetical protein
MVRSTIHRFGRTVKPLAQSKAFDDFHVDVFKYFAEGALKDWVLISAVGIEFQ